MVFLENKIIAKERVDGVKNINGCCKCFKEKVNLLKRIKLWFKKLFS